MQSTVRDPVIGLLVAGRYQVLARIARGGMATVYRAQDVRLGREIALKVMHPHLADSPEFVERFADEARAAASISHRNVVAVHDAGEDDEVVWLAMELLPGRSVRDLLRSRGGFTPAEAFDVVQAMLTALSEAHATGLIHRDVKPENVLIARDGTFKVNDFGLARAADSSRTATGSLLGTPEYIAPETAETGQVDARVDIYSTGIVLYELLTGLQPHTGQLPFQVVWAHVTTDVPAPSVLATYLPGEVDDLVAWACSRDPDRRPDDAQELLDAMRRVWAGLDPDVLDATPPSRVGANGTGSIGAGSNGAGSNGAGSNGAGATTRVLPVRTSRPAQARDASTVTIRRQDLARAGRDARGPAATTPTPAETRPPRRRRRVGATLLVLLFLASIAAGAAFTWFEVGPGAQRVVPELAGEPAGAAEDALAELGLASATTSAFDEVVPVGTVVGTEPPAGGSVHKDGRVTLVLSSGPELFGVPTLAGSTAGEAGQALADAGLRLGAVAEVFDAEAALGTVVSSNPVAGTELRSGTEVAVAVSRGPQPVEVPSVVGLTVDDAVAALDEGGLVVGEEVTEVYDPEVPAGSVRSQDPSDGELLPGAEVSLEVSLGPEPVEVPRLFDARYDDASAELQALGFLVERRGSSLLNRVVDQDPDPGTLLAPGSTVTLTTF